MKPIVIGLIGFIALAGWTTFTRWHFMCKMLDRCAESPMAGDDIKRTKDLSLTADGKTLLKDYEQFGFEVCSEEYLEDDLPHFEMFRV